MGYWKIYSGLGGRWISGGTDLQWLTERAAAGAFEAIAQREDISKVICIHWSSSHDDLLVSRNQQHTPIDEDRHKDHAPIEALEPLLQKNQERNWKLKFVILHGAYPQHRRLAAMTNRYPDQLFIEIGAIFAGLVVLFHEPEGVRRFVEQLRTEANPRSVLWGTDAIWYGSPQWQIEAFKRLNLEGDAANASAFKLNVLRSNAARLLPL
jgi:predicted TIM-barrel fold metal-dependent hydrolase